MLGALYVAKTGLSAQDTQLSTISNNLANAATTGFKKDKTVFQDLMYQVRQQPGAASTENSLLPSGLQMGTGVRVVGTQKQFANGTLEVTEDPMNIAINGRGFLQYTDPNGEQLYTRDGQLHMNNDGQLVSAQGFVLDPQITIPVDAQAVTIGLDGTVSATIPGQADPVQLGQIQLANFTNESGLQALGNNFFKETAASGAPQVGNPAEAGLGQIVQGALENSNVNAVEELVQMITTQRTYEMNSKVISTADQMLSFVTQQL